MLDYRIDTFLTLCESMNYRKTAEILHISQPAVTQQIHYLENQYGQKLFQIRKPPSGKNRGGGDTGKIRAGSQAAGAGSQAKAGKQPHSHPADRGHQNHRRLLPESRHPPLPQKPRQRPDPDRGQYGAPSAAAGGKRAGFCRGGGLFRQNPL